MSRGDVLIIGSGISALTSAVLLARKGKSVTVLEQYTKPGGYLHCFSRFGERYDTGAHYVGAMDPGHPFHTLLSYLNVYDDSLFVPLDPEAFDVFHFPNFTVSLPKGYENVEAALCAAFPTEKAAIRKFLELIRNAVTFFPTYEFNDNFNEVPAKEIYETSLADTVASLTSHPELTCALFSYCTLHGVNPEDVGFGFHAIVVDSLIRSPYGLKAGGDALAEKFVAELERLGGRVLYKKRVTEIAVDGRQVTSVKCEDGDEFSAEWVISAIHPKSTLNLCNDRSAFSAVFEKRMENLKESVGLFGISALAEGLDIGPLRNYYFFDSSDPKHFFRLKEMKDVPSAIFLSPAKREISNDGTMPLNLHVAGPIEWFAPWKESRYARRGDDYKTAKNEISENVFAGVERYWPGFRAKIKKFSASTPLTNLHFNGSVDGSAYGLYHSMQNTGPRAIGPRTKVLNLLLTGQNSLFPGLLGGAISGLRTTGHIVGIKPVLSELKELGARA